MKFTRIVSAFCLISFFLVSFIFPQNKSKDKKSKEKPVVVKANVAVLDTNGNLVNDIKLENLTVFEDGIEQKITYFAQKEPILNLVLVFDNTGSMRKNFDEIFKISSVFGDLFLLDKNEVFVVRFVDSDKIEIKQEWTSSKKDAQEAIDLMYIEGGQSAILDAVYLSAETLLAREKHVKSKRYAMLLISDGEDRDSYYDYKQTIALFGGTDLQVFLLSFAETAPKDKKDARFLTHLLTLETGGTAYLMPKKFTQNDIIEALKKIAGELRSQYVIGYTSTNQKRDGSMRKLTVQVADSEKGEKRQGFIREGFVVPKD
ncbi:MAG TPA: VWA domain-containing protein [Pyrinomonadaceae bacterium]|nr:VWA domain-containing protein [Pyrinomonadaceae bacterium]